jgi:hypothetical protein
MKRDMNQIPLFDELWDYDQPGQTEARLRALLPQAEAVSDATYHVQLLSQIARAQGLQQQFEAAHALLDEAETLLAQAKPLARIRVCLERGRLLNSARTADCPTGNLPARHVQQTIIIITRLFKHSQCLLILLIVMVRPANIVVKRTQPTT